MPGAFTTIKVVAEAHDDGVWAVSWARRGNRIVTASVDETVKIWWVQLTFDVELMGDLFRKGDDLTPLHTLEGHQLGVVSVDTSPSGQYAVSTSLDSQIRVWDLAAHNLVRTIDAGPVEAWTSAISPDGRQIAAGTHSGMINLWMETGEKEKPLDTRGKFVMSVAYSPNGMHLASGAENGSIHIFDVPTGKLLHSLPGHSQAVRSVAFSPDSSTLITASDDRRINVYDVHHASCLATITGHGSWVLSVAYSPDSNHFASGSSDKTVKVWDVGERKCLHTFNDHTDQVWGVSYNEDGSRLVSVSDDRSIAMYST